MTTLAQLRKAALALPEVEEATQFGMVAFEVRGNGFASVTEEGLVQLTMSHDETERVLARFPMVERLTRQGKPLGIRFPLGAVNGMELNSLVEKSWMSRAPKRLAAARREANSGEAPAGPDSLPKSIGKPATRALLGAGVGTLQDVAEKTETELLALHGFGPKAARLLAAALAERGLKFRRNGG